MPYAAAMEEEASGLSFTPPSNFVPPDDFEEGKPFDIVASVVMSNGKLSLKALNGAPLGEIEDEEEDAEAESESEGMDQEEQMPGEDGGSTIASQLTEYLS